MTTYAEYKKQIEELEVKAEAQRRVELNSVIDKIKELMSQYGITIHDLEAKSTKVKGPKKGSTVPPKYKDPSSGKTWTGRGQPPTWMKKALAAGRDKSDFLIL